MINRLFHLVDQKKEFPISSQRQPNRRFSGYSAVHYRIRLREQDLNEPETRYAAAKIEVQVASVLMHAWAEVEHDLVYKPLKGELSEEEHALLDQLNGLVMAGEISLEGLQKAGEARVGVKGRKFANHYDLAVHLLSRAADMTELTEPIGDSGLGRVDLLFDLITRLGIDTPELLEPYLKALNGNVELRPLAEQIIESLLTEDASRYEVYSTIRAQRGSSTLGAEPGDEDVHRLLGKFMTQWTRLEQVVRNLVPVAVPTLPSARQLHSMELLSDTDVAEYDRLRRYRSAWVHGTEAPTAADLTVATERLEAVTDTIVRRTNPPTGDRPD